MQYVFPERKLCTFETATEQIYRPLKIRSVSKRRSKRRRRNTHTHTRAKNEFPKTISYRRCRRRRRRRRHRPSRRSVPIVDILYYTNARVLYTYINIYILRRAARNTRNT